MRDITRRAIKSINNVNATENGFIFTDEEGKSIIAEVKETEKTITVKCEGNGKKCSFRMAWDTFTSNGWFVFWLSGIGYRAAEVLYR